MTGVEKKVRKDLGGKTLTIKDVETYMNSMDAMPQGTICGRRAAVKKLWYEQHGRTKESFSEIEWFFSNYRKTTKRIINTRQYLDDNEAKKLISETLNKSGRDATIMAFLYFTGLRIEEALSIKQRDTTKTNNGVRIKVKTEKTGLQTERVIPAEFFHEINKLFSGNEYLFETSSGKKIAREYVSGRIRTQSMRVLGKRVSAHSFRHLWVRNMVAKGEKPEKIAKMMGHRKIGSYLNSYYHE